MKALRLVFETLGGARELPASLERSRIGSVALGLWWVGLLLLTYSFAGRTVKFVYIDF
jgi:hypothetical protein